jgi:hypothetical protein
MLCLPLPLSRFNILHSAAYKYYTMNYDAMCDDAVEIREGEVRLFD